MQVACSNWLRVFAILGGLSDIIISNIHGGRVGFRKLSSYTDVEIKFILENYYKFISVRHPLERILSAFRNKFNDTRPLIGTFPSGFNKHLGTEIIKTYRQNPTENSLKIGDITFKEFALYLIDNSESHFNEHWAKYVDLCHPCYIKYNIIGKFDKFDEERDYVLREIGVDHIAQFPDQDRYNSGYAKTDTVIQDMFAVFTNEELIKLKQVYDKDFLLFGYDISKLIK